MDELRDGTLIRVDAYIVGEPEMLGGAPKFLQSLTSRWFDEFAHFCDDHGSCE